MKKELQDKQYFSLMILLVGFITFVRIIVLDRLQLNLLPDEAQYWFWSKFPEFGYYSKPPMIAWAIGLSTHFLGDSEFAVRLFAPIIHSVIAIMLYYLALELRSSKMGFWVALTYITLPGVFYSSLLMTTDLFLLLFWCLTLYFFLLATKRNEMKYWVLAGFFAGLGMLSKYTMVLFVPLSFLYLLYHEKSLKKVVLKAEYYVFLGITLVMYMPNFLWNVKNDFVSYSHTKDISKLDQFGLQFQNMFEFISVQFLLVGPVLFSLFVVMMFLFFKLTRARGYIFLELFSIPIVFLFVGLGLIGGAFGNWAAFAYVAGSALVVLYLENTRHHYLVLVSIIVNIFLGLSIWQVSLYADFVERNNFSEAINESLTKAASKFKGYDEFGDRVKFIAGQNDNPIIVADERKLMAELVYYMKPYEFSKFKKYRSYENVRDHFDLVMPFTEETDKFIFITRENNETDKLFAKSELIELYKLPSGITCKIMKVNYE